MPVLTESAAIDTYGATHIDLALAAAKPKATSGASTYAESTASFRAHYRNMPSVGDYDEHELSLVAGSYTLVLEGWVGASLGRIAVSLDGEQVGIVDQFSAASTVANRAVFPGLSVRRSGVHTLRFTVAAKNPSSSGTAVRLTHASLTREGPSAIPDPFSWTYRAADFTPRSIGLDGAVYGNGGAGGRVLMRSVDGGITFEAGADFASLVGGGEYIQFVTRTTDGFLVITSTDVSVAGNTGRIWFSPSFTVGFSAAQAINGTNEFSVSKPETGPNGKTWLAVGEYSTDMPQPPHRLWHSSDGGQSWRNIRTANVTNSAKNSHYHGCVHDPSAGMRLWSSQGDNENSRFSYTDNPQAASPTWVDVQMDPSHPLYREAPGQQPTTVGVFPGRLFVSPDRLAVSAMWSVRTASPANPEEVWQSPNAEPSQNVFGRSPYAQVDSRAVVIIPDRLEGTNKAYFVATGDSGKTWHLLHTMQLASPGSGSRGVVGPDRNGLIFYRSINNPAPASSYLMVAPMPTFRALP
ncbi:hypothetical protein ACTHQY_19300 [Rhodococcoides corynebacterioides]|uniref:hypothetical protein n=1 Tax=Rhodococcoides corynebacterioides TaxID=53972 RepID=UPI003F7DAB66